MFTSPIRFPSPQMILTANPGGVGMGWVKKRFVEPIDLRDGEYTKTELDNGDILYEDNKIKWWQHRYEWETEEGVKRLTIWNEIFDKEENAMAKEAAGRVIVFE